jgi:hypothetical protein
MSQRATLAKALPDVKVENAAKIMKIDDDFLSIAYSKINQQIG